MTTLVAQIAPQRSTQYATLAKDLAPHELKLSPLGRLISILDYLELGGQAYWKCELETNLDEVQIRELGMLAMTGVFFWYYAALGEYAGPLLRPIETGFQPCFSSDLMMTRRYKGKTNELFTQFLCNIARFSSDFSRQSWKNLRVFDPLAGGGTTLFAALMLGADVAGVEKNGKDVQSTATFLEQYARAQGITCSVKEERLKKLGKRWWFKLGRETPKQCVLASGETTHAIELISGFKKPHLIVADLPYGIQHHGQLTGLLRAALPVWASMLAPGGAMALAWESTRFSRQEMVSLVEAEGPLLVLSEPPYNMLVHRVDRVIKQRDVVVARPIT
ncbi:MAG: hypothetical protein JW953_22295 [Anaerolineae bacterium]|nr:hypothetical protein [Anaerolineae bacterium]